MISVRTFRVILLLLVACMLFGSVSLVWSRHALPPELESYKQSTVAADRATGHLAWDAAIGSAIILAYVVAIIGLFLLRPFARILFALLVGFSFVATFYYGVRIQTRSVATFDDAVTLLNGILLALLYCSPIRERFNRSTVA